jgi:hypothetical protein
MLPPDETGNPQRPTQNATRPGQQTTVQTMPDWVKTAILWLLILAGAIILLIGQYRLRILARRRYLRRGDPNRQALNRYRLIRMRSRLLRKPIPSQMTELAEKAKFSPHDISHEELEQFQSYFRQGQEKLKNYPIRRIYARWIRVLY